MGIRCECWDTGCPEQHLNDQGGGAQCPRDAEWVLARVDFAGEPRLSVCDGCGSDALESGVFAVVEDLEDEEEED